MPMEGDTDASSRIAIFDFDVHHGNGTEEEFYDDPDVLYVSWHQQGLFPGTGRLGETGGEGAEGSNLNINLPSGSAPVQVHPVPPPRFH